MIANRALPCLGSFIGLSKPCGLLLLALLSGCVDLKVKKDPPESKTVPKVASTQIVSANEMRRQLGANSTARFDRQGMDYVAASLARSGTKTLLPLQGQPLRFLDLSYTTVEDLGPCREMPLEKLILRGCRVKDLSPIAEVPLAHLDASECSGVDLTTLAANSHIRELYLENANISDLAPLTDMTLTHLYVPGSPLSDLHPLSGMPLQELSLDNTQVVDISPLKDANLSVVMLRNTGVSDVSPLIGQTITSLDIQGCPVTDCVEIGRLPALERLNISHTKINDLTPLAGLQLKRLIFSPERINHGISVIREIQSLEQIDVSFDGKQTPLTASRFWELYDLGKFNPE